ncbi:MAG: tetratricopeptide repeat protein [Planctomycetota bacterium]|jgi:non-specific serine/threonine protein kinase/serine/threonine-protein kinase
MAKKSTFGKDPDRLKRLLAVGLEEEGAKNEVGTASLEQIMEKPGGWIGRYKLISVLGEGGMGIVYLAEQERPIRRRVALKVIKPGMDSARVIARFEAERQALALLDHPSIAHVYDAGTTESGRPYFVMEYVEGLPITEHCDHHKLSIEHRLNLFLQVCHAINHAHHKGIIHRDIKPSNILVSTQDEQVVPKIIDFGVAKALAQPLTERTLVTEQGQLFGTPEYMSPEQADMVGEDIDTRSDIYALGVLLYVMLTGVLPFEPETLREGGIEHIRKMIRETDPKTPSTRLSKLGEAAEKIAESRRTKIETLARRLHKELEWIPLKAMRKERTERYRSASELADDIENYLRGDPLIAGPLTAVYRFKKFVRRNRVLVAGVAAVLAVLAGGVVVSMLFAFGQARARAEAQAVSDFLQQDVLASADPAKAKSPDVTVSYILDAASKNIDAKLEDQPLVEASIQHTLGKTYLNLGKYKKAKPHLERALQLRQKHLGEEHPDTAASIFKLGELYYRQGRSDEAVPLYIKALDIRRRVLGTEHPDTLRTMYYLAKLRWEDHRSREAESLLIKVLKLQRRVLGEEHPDTLRTMYGLGYVYSVYFGDQDHYNKKAEELLVDAKKGQSRVLGEDHPDTIKTIGSLGELYSLLGRHDEAEPLCVKALEVSRRVLGEEHPSTLLYMGDLAQLYWRWGRLDKAEPLFVKGIELNIRVFGEDHPETRYAMAWLADMYSSQGRHDKAELIWVKRLETARRVHGDEDIGTLPSMGDLALLYKRWGRYEEAERLYLSGLEISRRVRGERDQDTLSLIDGLGELRWKQGRYDEAEKLLHEALAHTREIWGEEHPDTLSTMAVLGLVYHSQGRYEEAESLFVKALNTSREVLGEEHLVTALSMYGLGELHLSQGRRDEAEPLLEEVLKIANDLLGEKHWRALAVMNMLAKLYMAQERYRKADSLFNETLKARLSKLGADHPDTLESKNDLAVLYKEQGDYDRAEPLLIEAVEGRRLKLGDKHPHTQESRKNLIDLYEACGQSEKAAQWRAKLPRKQSTQQQ